MIPLDSLTATIALNQFHADRMTAVQFLQSCLARIRARESTIQAWEYLNPDNALQQAEQRDIAKAQGQRPGALHGIPIAIKDTFATSDMPTGWGTPIRAGQQFSKDAAVVERLRSAGAVIVGKTVTTEYAAARANQTRNPHNPAHTPGGSSSGSAAAVADGMVPVAIGTQMIGSILRPASYCGILGFKPTFGSISRYGLMPSSRELDHVGIFARCIADIQAVLQVLATADDRDPDCHGVIAPHSVTHPALPRFALIPGIYWSQIEAEAEATLLHSVNRLKNAGAIVTEINLPPEFEQHLAQVNVLVAAGMATHHGTDYDRYAAQMSLQLRQLIEQGRSLTAIDYAKARDAAIDYNITLSALFTHYDAILTPVTTGAAPHGLENTGSPIFCALWTLCGLPTISIPIGKASNGLPLGMQIVGKRWKDWELLDMANWVITCLASTNNSAKAHSL